MAGKKGGLLSSIGNATGLGKVFGGTAKYLIPGIGGAIGVGEAVYGQTIKPINEAKREMKQEADRQAQIQADAEALAADQAKTAELSSQQKQKRATQKALAAGRGGRAGTILTSPLGLTGSASVGSKNLLGE
jgi:hypothetical protein